MKLARLLSLFIVTTISFWISSPASAREFSLPPFVTINIYDAPAAVVALNKSYLVYELYITNYMSTPITLNSLETTSGLKSSMIRSNDFEKFISVINPGNKDPLVFLPGESKMLHMWLAFDNLSNVPNEISHKLSLISDGQTFLIHTPEVKIDKTPVIVSAPLRGSYWVSANGLSNTSVHRISVLYFNGRPYDSERYAIDFLKTDKNSSSFKGDEHKNSSYYAYDQDVLAVANSKVVAIRDDIPENTPRSGKFAIHLDQKNMGGNYIILDLGNGKFAGYAHLIPGSLKVKVGDMVTAGQVIAKLGNSGHSTEPHLHFHIMNKPSMLVSNGLPYGFDHFNVIPTITKEKGFTFLNEKSKQYSNQLPLEDTVLEF